MSKDIGINKRQQITFELIHAFRKHVPSMIIGAICVLCGFFMIRTAGSNREYEVFIPLAICCLLTIGITCWHMNYEMRGLTARFYVNLPRDRKTAWNNHLIFLVSMIVWYEMWVVLGMAIQLGSAGLPTAQHVQIEWFMIPIYLSALILWVLSSPMNIPWIIMALVLGVCPFIWKQCEYSIFQVVMLQIEYLQGVSEYGTSYFTERQLPNGIYLSNHIPLWLDGLLAGIWLYIAYRMQRKAREVYI